MQFSFAQEKTVTGTVTDGKLPLSGANVKNGSRGVQTDADGKFAIKANVGDVLTVTSIGFEKQTIKVGSSNNYNVLLQGSQRTLDEVVILGYNQSRKKNEVTGNVAKVSGDVISKVPMVSIDQALQGKVAGLTIAATSGSPGSSQNIRIRGAQSLFAGNEPLYVIDGIPVVSGNVTGDTNASSLSILSSLSSDNIESMTVLKDASATSVYGAAGTNGVILVTTKRGKSGKTRFSATSTAGFQNNAVKGLRALTGAEKQTLLEDAVFNTYGASNGFTRSQALNYILNNVPTGTQTFVDWYNAGSKEYNWSGLMKNTDAPLYSLDINASGGDSKQSFYAALGYNKTEGTVIGTKFKRITASLNYSNQLTEKVKFSNNLSFSNIDQNAILEQSAYFANPNLTKYFMTPWANPYNADGTLNIDLAAQGVSVHNTKYLAENNITNNNLLRFLNNSTISYSIFKNLKFTSSLGLDYSLNAYRNYQNPFHGDGLNYGGYVEESYDRVFKYVTQNSFDYNFKLKENHKFEAKVLMEYWKTKYQGLYGFGQELTRPEFQYINGTSSNWSASSYYQNAMNLAYLGLLNYKFQNKYLIDLSFRRESSSRFQPENRIGNFYSVGTAWNINEESFLKNMESINLLRLRASYGTTGNAQVDINSYQSTIGSSTYNSGAAVSPSSYGANDKFLWEKANKFDVGTEFELFNSKVKGSLAYYKSVTFDMLQPSYPLSPTQGFDTQATNAGKMYNKGIEATINVDLLHKKNFNWSVGGNFTTLENRVTDFKYANGDLRNYTTGTRRIEEGHPMYEWYMRKWAGVDPATGSALWYINGVDGATTTNYNAAQVAFQGKNALPTFSGGLNTHLDAYNFFLDVSFYFAGGNKVYQDWAAYTSASSTRTTVTYNGTEDLLNRWQNPGDVTDVPKMEFVPSTFAASTSTRFLYDGDYVRLRDITFGYNFKGSSLKDLGFDGLTMSVRGTNILTWVKDSRLKYDPEVNASGITTLTTPPVKSVVFSINAKF